MSPKPKKTFQVRVERTVRQSILVTLTARDEKDALNTAEGMFRRGVISRWGAPEPVSTNYEIVEPPKET